MEVNGESQFIEGFIKSVASAVLDTESKDKLVNFMLELNLSQDQLNKFFELLGLLVRDTINISLMYLAEVLEDFNKVTGGQG